MFTVVFWKKLWSWIKHYWYFPIIIGLIIFAYISGSSAKEKLFKILTDQKENHKKEIELINNTNVEKEEIKKEIIEKHKEEIERIEKEHNVQIQDLEEEKQEELLSTIEQKKDKPDDLAKDIAALLNAKHVE
ncbi:MAG: hypothetical protein CL554_19560 [Algoriphagus sp.]|uniref:hypothetical protein n=1 Tax=Algoriphagus sp. TaxID=1872435 RepID=UPI000C5DA241|nr:hypothetical protein [Algoriphagus sp.]MAL15611.1 hypothetical protein [Algoriphagus sp.]|tara:strand:- start:176 stop:571 length:396 start_codon:yes stop_codon:yes gene_type:complete